MTHISNKGGMELIDLLLYKSDEILSCHGNQPWQITSPGSLSQEGGGDDFLDTLLGGTDSSSAPTSPLWPSSPCDSGTSEDPTSGSDHLDSPNPPSSPPFHAFYQAHLPNLQSHLTRPALHCLAPDVSIDLAGWESGLFQESNGDTHNPQVPSGYHLTVKDLLLSGIRDTNSLQEVVLNEDEKKLLGKEGVHLPSQLPLTKYEERVLKKIRRKIRNKQSAQESRKKKKEYVEGLEVRMDACSKHNLALQRKVHQLEETNTSLLEQLARLQTILRIGSSKTSQKGTCILVLLLSFSLLLSSSLQPDTHSHVSQEGDLSVAIGRSRSLLAVVDTEISPPPVFSVAGWVEALSTLVGKLRLRPEYADSDPQTNHNHDHNYDYNHSL
ncbi:cyclic AMP-responsive element-binding protein 3-like protein 3-B isoform X1 [Coregonus clupeaformis]|uniref:cyclic AMP-responsive element-binding protein 3-like protein 3-B isoform X1 n=2 Tax=Coregonus clupeaformis TaxID=59861 RepID=UPI001BE091A5|nr:cyclic AMP-responsive element-binding protein 3-like protein 3-B isoform X1 [Coregonus clupeaformis]